MSTPPCTCRALLLAEAKVLLEQADKAHVTPRLKAHEAALRVQGNAAGWAAGWLGKRRE